VLLVSQADIYQTSSSSYDGSTDHYKTFCCPCCASETDVKISSSIKIYGKQPSETEKKAIRDAFIASTKNGTVPVIEK
jgi:predicted lipoprotein